LRVSVDVSKETLRLVLESSLDLSSCLETDQSQVTAAMDEGIEHAGLLLELIPKPKGKKEEDVEEKADGSKP